MYLDPEDWKEYPVISTELHKAMAAIAELLEKLPVEFEYARFHKSEVTDIQMRAFWEHAKAKRISYCCLDDEPGVFFVYKLVGLAEWRATNDASPPSPDQQAASSPAGAEFTRIRLYDAEDVPAEFRDGGEPDGAPLTVEFLSRASVNWGFRPDEITNSFGSENGQLTERITVRSSKPGPNPFAFRYSELLVLRDQKTRKEDRI
jgi:hypothetical protein